MSDYTEHFARHLRLVILRLLAEATGYRLNASIIGDMVALHGLAASRAQIRTEIAWLGEQGMLTAEQLDAGLMVATLTERGHDVARGLASVPGVQRPGPGS